MDEACFTAIGYIVFTLYTVGIVFLGILLEKKTNIDKTISRKITHIISAGVWIICYFFFGCTLHWVLLNVIGTVVLGIVTLNKKFSFFQRDDAWKSFGMFYLGLSTAIVAVICYFVGEELYLYTGVAYFCLALGDGFAPIIAKLFKNHNVSICSNKTLVGTITVFIFSFLATFAFSSIFNMEFDWVFTLSVAALTAITEFYGFKGTDNILIEFFVFGYLVLYHYGMVFLPFEIVLICSPWLAMVAVGSGAMSVGAGACAFALFAIVGFFGNDFIPVLFVATLFVISTVVSAVGKHIEKKSQTQPPEERKTRRARQIIAVGIFSALAIILFRITKNIVLYYVFFLAFTEQFADSMASDIGKFTKRKNVNIITWQPVEKGISGGISLLGTVSALVSSFLLMCIPLSFGTVSIIVFLLIASFAFFGTIVDSIVGSLFQALYECDECSRKVEVAVHCGKNARLIKGFKLIDNVAVNYISGFITCLFGAFLCLI